MRAIASVCFLLVLLQGSNVNADLVPEEEVCVDELKLDRNEITLLNNQSIVPEDNPRFNEFLACYWQTMGLQDTKTGAINYVGLRKLFEDVVLKELNEEISLIRILIRQILNNITKECQQKELQGNSHGQTVAKVQNCILKSLLAIQADIQNAI